MEELAKAYSAAIGADVKKVHVSNPEKFGAVVNAVDMLKDEKVGQGVDPIEAGNAAFLDVFSEMGVDQFKSGIAPGLSMMLADKQKEELRNAPEPTQLERFGTVFARPFLMSRGGDKTEAAYSTPERRKEYSDAAGALFNFTTPTIPKSFTYSEENPTGGFNRVARETIRDFSSPFSMSLTALAPGVTQAGSVALRAAAAKASTPAKAKALKLAAKLIDDGTYARALRMEAQGELGGNLLVNALEDQGVEMNMAQQIAVGLIGGIGAIAGPALIKRGGGAAINATRQSLDPSNIAEPPRTSAGKVDRLLRETRRAESEQQRILDEATSERAGVVDDGIYEDPDDFIERGALPRTEDDGYGYRTEEGQRRLADLRYGENASRRSPESVEPHVDADGYPIPLSREDYEILGYGQGAPVAFREEILRPQERATGEIVRINKEGGIESVDSPPVPGEAPDLFVQLQRDIEGDPSRAAGNYKGMKEQAFLPRDHGVYVETRTPEEIASPITRGRGDFKVEYREPSYGYGDLGQNPKGGGAYTVYKKIDGEFEPVAEFSVYPADYDLKTRTHVNPDSGKSIEYNYGLSITGTDEYGYSLDYGNFDQKAVFGDGVKGAMNLARVLDKIVDYIEMAPLDGSPPGKVLGIKGSRLHGTKNTVALRANDIRNYAGGKIELPAGFKEANKQREVLGPVSSIVRNFKDVKIGLSRSFPNIDEELIDDQIEILKKRYLAVKTQPFSIHAGQGERRGLSEAEWLRSRFAGFNIDGLVMMDDGRLLSPSSESGVDASTVFVKPMALAQGEYAVAENVVRAVISTNFGRVAGDVDPQRMVTEVETMFHEIGHVIRRDLYDMNPDSRLILEKYSGVKNGIWTNDADEKFAQGYVNYLANPDDFLRAGLEGINLGGRGIQGLMEIFGQVTHWLRQVLLDDPSTGTGGRSSLTEVEFKAFDDIFYNPTAKENQPMWHRTVSDDQGRTILDKEGGGNRKLTEPFRNPNPWWTTSAANARTPGEIGGTTSSIPPRTRISEKEADVYLDRDPGSGRRTGPPGVENVSSQPRPRPMPDTNNQRGPLRYSPETTTPQVEGPSGIRMFDEDWDQAVEDGVQVWRDAPGYQPIETGDPSSIEYNPIIIQRVVPARGSVDSGNQLTYSVRVDGNFRPAAIVGFSRIPRSDPSVSNGNTWNMHMRSLGDATREGELFSDDLSAIGLSVIRDTSNTVRSVRNLPSLESDWDTPTRNFMDRGSRDEDALNAARERRRAAGMSLDDQLEADVAAARRGESIDESVVPDVTGRGDLDDTNPFARANRDVVLEENRAAQVLRDARVRQAERLGLDLENGADKALEKAALQGTAVPWADADRIVREDIRPRMVDIIKQVGRQTNADVDLRAAQNRQAAAASANIFSTSTATGEDIIKRGTAPLQATGEKPLSAMDRPPIRGPNADPANSLSEADMHLIFESIARNPRMRPYTKLNTAKAIWKLVDGEHLTKFDIQRLRSVFGKEVTAGMFDTRGWKRKTFDEIMDVLGIPRLLLATMDFSAPLRQALLPLGGHPLRWAKTWGPAWKGAISGKYYDAQRTKRQAHKNYRIFTEPSSPNLPENQRGLGLFETDPEAGLGQNEEAFLSEFLKRLPDRAGNLAAWTTRTPGAKKPVKSILSGIGTVAGYPIRFSERGWSGFLDELRFGLMNDAWESWKTPGSLDSNGKASFILDEATGDLVPTAQTLKDGRDLARYINISTGRGDLGMLEGAAAPLANIFFSPRLMAARFEAPYELIRWDRSKRVKNHIYRDMGGAMGGGATVLGLAAIAGASVELNPTSSDAGRIQVGNTRVDIWGGFQPLVRTIARVAMRERKSTGTGRITDLDKDGIGLVSQEIGNFFRAKLAPVVGFGTDIALGGDFTGDEIDFGSGNRMDLLISRFAPLLAQDLIESYRADGLTGAALAAPSFFGTSVISYQGVEEITRRDYKYPKDHPNKDRPGRKGLANLTDSDYSVFQDLPPFLQDNAIAMNKFEGSQKDSEFSAQIAQIDEDYFTTLVGIMDDMEKTDSQKVSAFFDAGNTRADKRSAAFETQYGEFVRSDDEPIDDNAKAMRSYYDMVANSINSDNSFNNDFFNSTYADYINSWSKEQNQWVRANTNTKVIPEAMWNILPDKQKENYKASSDARDALVKIWANDEAEVQAQIESRRLNVEEVRAGINQGQESIEENRRAARERDNLDPRDDYTPVDKTKTPVFIGDAPRRNRFTPSAAPSGVVPGTTKSKEPAGPVFIGSR